MGFLKKFFGKQNDKIAEHEVKAVADLVSKQEENFNDDEIIEIEDIPKFEDNNNKFEIKYEEIFAGIKIDEINQIRNFLNKKEFELTGKKSNSSVTAVNGKIQLDEKLKESENKIIKNFKPEEISEINIEEHITKKDLETKTYSEEEVENKFEIEKEKGKKKEKQNEINNNIIAIENFEKVQSSQKSTVKNLSNTQIQQVEFENRSFSKSSIGNKSKSENSTIYTEEKVEDNLEIGEEKMENSKKEVEEESKKTEKNTLEKNKEINLDVIREIKSIFGEENIFFEEGKKSTYQNINFKNIKFIGIRNKEGFKDNSNWTDQNKWFVENIKKLKELKSFKVLKSEEGLKDLVYNIDNENAIILSFRTTNLLKDENSFDFPLN